MDEIQQRAFVGRTPRYSPLDVSVLVGIETEREGRRKTQGGGGGGLRECTGGRLQSWQSLLALPFLSDRVNIEPATFVCLFRDPPLLDATTLNGTEQTGAQ